MVGISLGNTILNEECVKSKHNRPIGDGLLLGLPRNFVDLNSIALG